MSSPSGSGYAGILAGILCRVFAASLFMALVASADAAEPSGAGAEYRITLADNKGNSVVIGALRLARPLSGEPVDYSLHIDHGKFKDFFLSMKEFKCLEGPELWCFVPYPYFNPGQISSDDLSWLEQDLLFMFKDKTSFGANLWNGVYYRLTLEPSGVLSGVAHAVDLNLMAAPPEPATAPSIGEFDVEEMELDKRWLPYLRIEPVQ